MQIEALIEYVALFQEGPATVRARKEILIEQRELLQDKINEMQKTLARLDKKIQNYETIVVPAQDKLQITEA